MDNTQRDFLIAVQFMDGTPVPKLAQDHSLSVPAINRILAAQNVDRSQRRRVIIEDKVVDDHHDKIGKRLYHYRAFVAYEERLAASKTLGWSAKKLAMIEQGHTVLSLIDLRTIASYMKQSLSQLLEDL
jgi:hypothetical protein